MKSKHPFSRILLIAILSGWALSLAEAGLRKGMTRSEVIAELGKPTGEVKQGKNLLLFYGTASATLTDGRLHSVEGNLKQALTDVQERKEADEAARAAGKVMVDGKWLSQEEAEAVKADKVARAQAANAGKGGPVRIVRRGGAQMAIPDMLAPGKITVVDFFADWCGPCRAISPQLEALARQDPQVVVTKVDIVNWNTPLVKQHNIHSVPNMRVYDAQGRMVGKPTSSLQEVKANIAKAKG